MTLDDVEATPTKREVRFLLAEPRTWTSLMAAGWGTP